MLKKTILTAIVSLFCAAGLSVPALAAGGVFNQVCSSPGTANSSVCSDPNKPNPLYGSGGVLTKVADLVAIIVSVAAVIIIIISGIKYITANGDPGKIIQARDTIIYAIIGVIVALIARSIIVIVLKRL